jgi:Putative zinc-finger
MCNKEDLVSYLYDDLDAAARAAVERHLRDCVECRDELASMRTVRADLLQWSPPEPDFAFRIINEPRTPAGRHGTLLRPDVPSWRARLTPALGLAAAAVLVLAAAAGLAHIEVRNGPDGVTVRTGWSAAPAAPLADSSRREAARDVRLTSPQTDLGALEQRISALEAVSRDNAGATVRNASMLNARASDAEILKVVRELLAQSETRQKGELALRIAQVIRDVDAQRVADLSRLQQGMVRIDANVTEEAKAHGELMNYILANSKQK